MMSGEAVISISSMILGLVGILHVLKAYRETVKSAEPDPKRVRKFVDSAPPLSAHLRSQEGEDTVS